MKLDQLPLMLKNTRIAKGILQKEAAAKLNISPSLLSQLENSHIPMTLTTAQRYLQLLELKMEIPDPAFDFPVSKDIYELKLFDQKLLKFSIETTFASTPLVHILSAKPSTSHLLPKDLDISDDGLYAWLQHRLIPKNRTHAEQILDSLSLTRNDFKDLIDDSKGLSLNDSYWISKKDDPVSFFQTNLYDNRFCEELSLAAWTGSTSKIHDFSTSPELTTNGVLAKAWRHFDDRGTFLYKQGSLGLIYGGKEPFHEVYTSMIGKQMGLHIVEYHLETWEGKISSVCPLFTSSEVSYIPIGRIVTKGGIEAVEKFYRDMGSEYYEEFASMIVFDALICNEDRHFGNFGLLVDSRTNQWLVPAPLFDHGISLLNDVPTGSLKNYKTFTQYAVSRTNPYQLGFLELAEKVMDPVQQQLKKLIGFKLPKLEGYPGFSQKRLKLLQRLLKNRVSELLRLPVHR